MIIIMRRGVVNFLMNKTDLRLSVPTVDHKTKNCENLKMISEVYFKQFSKAFAFGMEVLNPFPASDGNSKLSKM